MPARLISFDDVKRVCDQIKKEGEQPTTLLVHKALGRGSFTTIQNFVKQWEMSGIALEPPVAANDEELSEEVVTESLDFIKQLHALAEREKQIEIARVQEEADQHVAAAQHKADEAAAFADEMHSKSEALNGELTLARQAQKEQSALIKELTKQVTQLQKMLEKQDKAVLSAHQNAEVLAIQKGELETSLKLANAEVDQVRKGRTLAEQHHKQLFSEMAQDHAKETRRLRDNYEKDVTHLNTVNQKLVAAAESKVVELERRLEQTQSEVTKKDQAIAGIYETLDQQRQQNSVLEKHNVQISAKLDKAVQENKQLKAANKKR